MNDNPDRGPELINQISDLMLLAEAKGWANLDLPHESLEDDMGIIIRSVKDRGIKIEDFLITLRPSNGHWELMIFILENPEYGGKSNGKNKRETDRPKL